MDRLKKPEEGIIEIGADNSSLLFQRFRENKAERIALDSISPFLRIGVLIQIVILIISLAIYRLLVFPIFNSRDSHSSYVISVMIFFGLLIFFARWQARKLRRELVDIYFEEGLVKKQKIEEIVRRSAFYLVFALIAGSFCFLMRLGFLFLQF